MGVSWWSTMLWVFFPFIVLGPWWILSIKKLKFFSHKMFTVITLILYALLSAFLFVRFGFYFWNSFYLLDWSSKFSMFNLFFSDCLYMCVRVLFLLFYSQEDSSNFIFQTSFIFLISYFKLPRILSWLWLLFSLGCRSYSIDAVNSLDSLKILITDF